MEGKVDLNTVDRINVALMVKAVESAAQNHASQMSESRKVPQASNRVLDVKA